jgi:hypothetical protein
MKEKSITYLGSFIFVTLSVHTCIHVIDIVLKRDI